MSEIGCQVPTLATGSQGEEDQEASKSVLYSPSPGMIRSVTVFPASLMRLTISEWDLLVMEHPFTARMRSPTFSFPQRSAGLPSMMRPILWGMATHALPAMVNIDKLGGVCVCVCASVFGGKFGETRKKKGKQGKEQRKKVKG